MNKFNIKEFIIDKLEEKKAENIVIYSKEDFNISSSYVFIASGRSTKNVCAIADNLSLELKN
jgi:ribosomal silencing factor RsfS